VHREARVGARLSIVSLNCAKQASSSAQNKGALVPEITMECPLVIVAFKNTHRMNVPNCPMCLCSPLLLASLTAVVLVWFLVELLAYQVSL